MIILNYFATIISVKGERMKNLIFWGINDF